MLRRFNLDRPTIARKYHIPEEPFNPYFRMDYHGYPYDEATGLDEETMKANLADLSASLEEQPRPIHKATLFAYVLDHTRIDVNAHDYFVGIYAWGRLISPHTCMKWFKERKNAHPEAMAIMAAYGGAAAGSGGLDFDHTVPDWTSLIELGFSGVLERARASYEAHLAAGTLTPQKEAFWRGIEIEYSAILRLIDRLYRYALTKTFDKAPKIAECLHQLRSGAPRNTYEVMQLIYLYFMLSESVEHYQVRSLGYGLDDTLYPFYARDLANGTYTREEIGELLAYFLFQWQAIGNYWGQPLYLGGMHADGSTRVTELSHLILDIYDQLGIYNPKIQIKVNGSTPGDFVRRALDMIRRGKNSIVFCNDDTIIRAMMSRGATYEEAADAVISGCFEYKKRAGGIDLSGASVNAVKPVALVLDNGFDRVTGRQLGPRTGEPGDFPDFAAFYRAYLRQTEHIWTTVLDALDALEADNAGINPALMFSATLPCCVESLTDALESGTENDTGVQISGIGTGVDALMAVYELVYEKKLATLAELRDAVAANWEGHARLRAASLRCRHKYGNGDPMADHYAAAILRFTCDLLAGRRNSHGGRYIMELHAARSFINHGKKTQASPDGRRTGEEISKNASPTMGADRCGITALINSATTLDTALANNGFCLDAMLLPSAVAGEEGLEIFYALLNTYLAKGGASIQFNICDADTLRDAQADPQKYPNLQIRVCGWNVLWNNMAKVEQDAYILRAENIQ